MAEVMTPEPLPQWLRDWKPGAAITMEQFFASRAVFYPGSGTDGQPVKFFGSRHAAHCFVYADYGLPRDHVERELGDSGHPFRGYQRAGRVELSERELTPCGWQAHVRPERDPGQHASERSYAFLQILDRQSGFDDSHGPQRLALLILCADAVATYDALWCQSDSLANAPYAVVLQDHGYGGNYTKFGRGGYLEELASTTRRLPSLLLVAENTQAWSGYAIIEDEADGDGGMHHYKRQIWQLDAATTSNPTSRKALNMPVRQHWLERQGFVHTHTVVMDGDMPNFHMMAQPPDSASVYLWLSPASPDEIEDGFDVLYVGKAGFGVDRRLRQHCGGFLNSGTGRKNRALIADWIASGRKIMVFARVSATHEVFGTQVSLYSTEEAALCDLLVPRWNRATFPRTAETPRTEETRAVQQIPNVAADAVPQVVDPIAVNGMGAEDEINVFYETLSEEKQVLFTQLCALVGGRDPIAGQKIVRGYSGMPRGYDATPMLVFGRISRAGLAMDALGRIPLVDEENSPLTVIFRDSDRANNVDEALISVGANGCWRPLDVSHFLQHPIAYLR